MDHYANYAGNYANGEVLWGLKAVVTVLLWHFVTSEAFPAASPAQFPAPISPPVPPGPLGAAATSTPAVFLGGPLLSPCPHQLAQGGVSLALSWLWGQGWARWHPVPHPPPPQVSPWGKLPGVSAGMTGLLAIPPSISSGGRLLFRKDVLLDVGLENH